MVEILCPHCDEEIGLDDDTVGEFSCPYCDKDFSWDGDFHTNDLKVKLLLFLFGMFSPGLILFASLFNGEHYLDLIISIGICLLYTVSLAIYAEWKKNKPLGNGLVLSFVVSFFLLRLFISP
jgi:hypothetical protein